jgi:hypothetical protein
MTVLDHPTRRRNTAKPRRSTTKRSAPARKHTNAPTKTALLKELDGLVRGIERSAINPTWKLADWLVENTDDRARRRPDQARPNALDHPGSSRRQWVLRTLVPRDARHRSALL